MSMHYQQTARRSPHLAAWFGPINALAWRSTTSSSEHQESQVMPRWLFLTYRLATALAILMLVAAAVSLVVSAFLGIASLWHWDILKATGLQSLSARI